MNSNQKTLIEQRLYDPKYDDPDTRQRAVEEIAIALRSQRVNGKLVHIPEIGQFINAYIRIEELLREPIA